MADAAQEAVDDEEEVDLPSHETRLQWFEDWRDNQRKPRERARLRRDFYDGKQWTDKELETLAERGQPPATDNLIAKLVNAVIGDEIEKRTDPFAKPRTPQHEDDARAATDALRFVADQQKSNQVRTSVLKNMLVEGIGGAIKRIDERGDHKLDHVEYEDLFYDIFSRSHDFSDALYKGIIRKLEIDDAIDMFPDAQEMLEEAMGRSSYFADDLAGGMPRDWMDRKRKLVWIAEMYFRVGEDWYQAFFTKAGDLADPIKCPYLDEHGRAVCPLEMVHAYADAEGNRYGPVENYLSPQERINKRESKSLHLLSVDQTMAETGMVPQPQELRTARARPDGFYGDFAPNALQEGRVQFMRHLDLSQGHMMLLHEAKQSLGAIGPSMSSIPEMPGGASGVAITARRRAASLDHGEVFDHLSAWDERIAKLNWICIRQTWTEEKWLRVTDDKELTGHRFVVLNRKMTRAQRFQELMQKQDTQLKAEPALEIAAGVFAPMILTNAQQQIQMMMQQAQATGQKPPPADQLLVQAILSNPLMGEVITTNQAAQMEVDIVIDRAKDTASIIEQQFESLSQIVPQAIQSRPDIALDLIKMLVRSSSLPDKRDVMAALEKPAGPSPEQKKMQEQMQQMQQQMLQLEAGLKQALIQKTQADAQLSLARAQSEMAGAGQGQAPEQPDPLKYAKAQREMANINFDAQRTEAEANRDNAAAVKHQTDAAAKAHEMMQPQVVAVEVGP